MRIVILILVLTSFLYSQQKNEFRAVWLTNVDSYVLASDESIIEAMDYLASININVVMPVVYNKGYTLYPSKVMDSLFGQPTIPNTSFSTRDYLERLVIEAHRNGIEVIPWFEFGFSSSYSLNGGHIVEKFPEWAAKDRNGNLMVKNGFDWLAGTNPEVQNYILSLITEVLDNYDVDGVQGDDRLPAMPYEAGYDEATIEIYKAEHNGQTPPNNYSNSEWMKWRADKLTEYLGRMRDSVKARSEYLILSVSPSPYYWGYREYLQDSKTWAQLNLLDNIVPQLYQYDIGSYNYALDNTWNDVGQYDPEDFFAGILMNVGTYLIESSLLDRKVKANRDKGVNGESFFFYEGLRKNDNELGDFLVENHYSERAILPYRKGKIWRPKAVIKNESDNGIVINGEWEEYQLQGYEGGILRTNVTSQYASVEYTASILDEAYYDLYIYKTPNTPWTKAAAYTLYSGDDSTIVTVDQSDLSKRGWHKIGISYLNEGDQKIIKVDNSNLEEGKYLVTDAVMIMINRKLSPDVIVSIDKDDKELEQIPSGIKLYQNYPNPFNPSTIIRYCIGNGDILNSSSQKVTLTVYDLLGKETEILVSENQIPGNYKINFNADGISNGVYFYSLRVGNKVVSKKMILLK